MSEERKEFDPASIPPAVEKVKVALDEMNKDFRLFKETNEKLIKAEENNSGLVKEHNAKLEKIEKNIGDLDKKIADLTLKANAPKQTDAKEENIIGARKLLCATVRAAASQNGNNYLRDGDLETLQAHKLEMQKNVLSSGDSTLGGFTVNPTIELGILKGITEISPMRSLVSVKQVTRGNQWEKVKRTGQFAAVHIGEQGTRAETTGYTLGQAKVPVFECYAMVYPTHQLLEDSDENMESEIMQEMSEQFALLEGTDLVAGTGIAMGQGFTVNAAVVAAYVASGTAAKITADGIIDLHYAVKTGYAARSQFVLNRSSLKVIRKLKDGMANYLWTPGIAGARPNTIDGEPYTEMPDMPSEGSNTYPIAYGDFKSAIVLAEKVGIKFERISDTTTAAAGTICLYAYRRYGCGVVLVEAVKLLKCAAS